MPKDVLCATDLTPRSAAAAARAAWLAGRWNGALTLLHVADSEQLSAVVEDEIRDTTAALKAEAEALPGGGERRIVVRRGDPFEEILETAAAIGAALVVVGTHRRRRLIDIFRGTTAERVIRSGRMPVLTAREAPPAPWRHAIVALDFSESACHALRTARDLGMLEGARVTVVHAFVPVTRMVMSYQGVPAQAIRREIAAERADLRRRVQRFVADCDPSLRAEVVVVEGDAPGALQKVVAEKGADLLVLGTRGASGIRRLILGSVAEAVLARAAVDVLAVPPP